MKCLYFLSCWGNAIALPEAIGKAGQWGYDGVEGPPPADPELRQDTAAEMARHNTTYIAEIATGGHYVPAAGMSVQAHLDDLDHHLSERISAFDPIFVNVLGGSDRWSFTECVYFYTKGIELGLAHGHQISWETHRSRPTFNPWATRDLLQELPQMQLNCDFSHWCVVCERLVMDEEPEILELCAERCLHVHARVGYDQSPQVPDPRDRLHEAQLAAHLCWWRRLKQTAVGRGLSSFTITPEFGPDGYLQVRPVSHEPAADLREVNRWMADRLRRSDDQTFD